MFDHFDSVGLSESYSGLPPFQYSPIPTPEELFGQPKSTEQITTASATATTTTTTTAASAVTSSTSTPPSYAHWNGTISHFSESRSGLPQPQSATITLLQKSRGECGYYVTYRDGTGGY